MKKLHCSMCDFSRSKLLDFSSKLRGKVTKEMECMLKLGFPETNPLMSTWKSTYFYKIESPALDIRLCLQLNNMVSVIFNYAMQT